MTEYLTTAVIDAPAEHVWEILTSAAGYRDWNPEIIEIRGTMPAGARIASIGGR